MAVVLEVLNRSGQVLRYQVFDQQQVTVGRAYNNDFVINDLYVDPVHMTVFSVDDANQFDCLDRDSVNGIAQRKKVQGSLRIGSGEQIVLGKTILRISSFDQVLAPAVPLSYWETAADILSCWWLVFVLAVLFVLSHAFDTWIDNPLVEHKASLYINVFYVFIGVVICAGFYTFLAKILRHDTRFFLYFNIILCALIISYVYGFVEPMITVNLSSTVSATIVGVAFSCILLWLFVYVSLRYSSHLTVLSRAFVAVILPIVVMLVSFSDVFDKDDRFQALPPYDPEVVHSAWYWRDGAIKQEFIMATKELYAQDPID